jgi:hypothetical protein
VFISYVREDRDAALQLRAELLSLGVRPWLDIVDLVPGQDWQVTIKHALRESSHVIVLISQTSVGKRGFVQKEVRDALDLLGELPPNETFIIPVRLDGSQPAHDALARLHWVDLFADYRLGLQEIARALGIVAETTPNQGRVGLADGLEIAEGSNVRADRPRVIFELVAGASDAAPVQIVAHNDYAAAVNVNAVCRLSEQHSIQFGPISRIGSNPVLVPIRLVENARHVADSDGTVSQRLLHEFLYRARQQIIADAAWTLWEGRAEAPGESQRGAARQLQESNDELNTALATRGLLPSRELIVPFEVTYTDFDRVWRYRTPHVLRHSNREHYKRIELAEVPEPAPSKIGEFRAG